MQSSPQALLTILGMALVTYITRMSGLWLMGRIPLFGWLKAWLEYLPGTILVAIVAPAVFGTGWPETGAALATLCVAVRTRNVLLSMIIGIVVVMVLRWCSSGLLNL